MFLPIQSCWLIRSQVNSVFYVSHATYSCWPCFIFLGPENPAGPKNPAGVEIQKMVFPAISIYPTSVPASRAHDSMTHFVRLLDNRSVMLSSIYIILSHFKLFQDNLCLVFYPFGLLVFKSFSLLVLTTARDCKVLALFFLEWA